MSPRLDGLLEGLATTRTIRRYTAEPVPDADLSTILWHATRAPSGSNRQPVRYLVLRDDGGAAQEARRLIGEAARAVWNGKYERDGYKDGSGADPDSPKARTAAAMQQYVDGFEHVPVVVLVCLQRYRAATPYEGGSVYPAVQNLLLAAHALGFAAKWSTGRNAYARVVRDGLGLQAQEQIAGLLYLGTPLQPQAPSPRPDVESFTEVWNG